MYDSNENKKYKYFSSRVLEEAVYSIRKYSLGIYGSKTKYKGPIKTIFSYIKTFQFMIFMILTSKTHLKFKFILL